MDRLLPDVPYRQWVLTFPWALRSRLACDRALFSRMLQVFLRTLFAWQRRRGRALGVAGMETAQTGSVSFIQRFTQDLRLFPHVHVVVHNAALLAERDVILRPVTDPDGRTFPGYVELWTDAGLLERQLTFGGRVVTRCDGQGTLEAALRAAGLPRELCSPYLLTELLQAFALLPTGFAWSTRASWAPLSHAVLRREGDGAVLALEQTRPGLDSATAEGASGAPGVDGLVPRRLEVRFDSEARISIRLFEDRGAGFRQAPLR